MAEENHLLTTDFRKITAEEQQEEFCSYLGYQSETIWDEYDPEMHPDVKSLLLRKINLIFGDEIDETVESDADSVPTTPSRQSLPTTPTSSDGSIAGETSGDGGDQDDKKSKKIAAKKLAKKEKFKKMKENLVEAIWNQRKYNKDTLLMSPIFVALVSDYEQYEQDLSWCRYSLSYSLHPVFRIMRCRKNGDSHGCCMIFVDEYARVYQNWEEFKVNNEYPPGYLVAPTLGVYNTERSIDSDHFNRVLLDVFPSSCITASSKFAATADTVTTVGGLAATGVTIASIASIPMLPIVAAGALVTGLGCAAYSVGRSAYKLIDRSKHEQTINLTDTEARSHWFGIAAGAVGLGAGAATGRLSAAAGRGSNISKVVTGSVNILNGAAIVLNGVGTLNGIYAIFLKKQDGEDISMFEILQFSSSLFIFTHSVYNFQTAGNIVRSSRATTIGEYRRGLSRNQQRAFDKLVKETIRQKGVDGGHADVIRSLRNIQDTKQFFGDAYKVNKELNKNNVKMSLHPDGEILLNDAKAITPTELRNALKQASQQEVFANLPSIPESHPAAGVVNLQEFNGTSSSAVSREHIGMAIQGLVQVGIRLGREEDLESTMIDLAEQVTLQVFDTFVDFMSAYFTKNCRWMSEGLNIPLPFEDCFTITLNIVCRLAKEAGVDIGEYIENVDWNFLRLQINEFFERLRNRRVRRGQPTEHCKICSGSYYV